MGAATVEICGPIRIHPTPESVDPLMRPFIHYRLIVSTPKVALDMMSSIHVSLSRILDILAKFRDDVVYWYSIQ